MSWYPVLYMQMIKKQWVMALIGTVVVVGVGFGGWYYVSHRVAPFPINSTDTISSWTFKGVYTGNDTLIAQAAADVEKLTALLGTGEYDDYDLYIGMGNDANLIGDGKTAYQAYNKAISIHPSKGLAYANLAHLMDQLGAYSTAADAYAQAVAVESPQLEYHVERLNYLTRQFPGDQEQLLAAFTDAHTQFGDMPAILAIKAQWLSAGGHYTEAIEVWQTVKVLSPTERKASIDAEIARLKKKQ